MNKEDRVFVAGHRGLVGSALIRALSREGFKQVITSSRETLDLTDQKAVNTFFQKEKPAYVFLAAAKVGGIMANRDFPADFVYQNLTIETNVIHAAHEHTVKKLLFLGSSCIYPKHAPQPIQEEYLLSGPLEETNRAYAVAKIAGIELCRSYHAQWGDDFIAAMPTNLYGPGDHFNLETSHVIPALVRKFHEAKELGANTVVVWGTGNPRREFMYVDDLAEACIFLMRQYSDTIPINVGTGVDVTIRELAQLIKKTVGFEGDIVWDTEKPDGTPRKLLDVSRLSNLGWHSHITLDEGLQKTYDWYRNHAHA